MNYTIIQVVISFAMLVMAILTYFKRKN